MKGKIALEEHVSTQENNRLWDSKAKRCEMAVIIWIMLKNAFWKPNCA